MPSPPERPSRRAEVARRLRHRRASPLAVYGSVLTLAVIVGVSEDLTASADLYLVSRMSASSALAR